MMKQSIEDMPIAAYQLQEKRRMMAIPVANHSHKVVLLIGCILYSRYVVN
jgi:hypothetical protein